MEGESRGPVWASGDAYESYVGRWSRLVAQEFVDWLGVAPGSAWLDVGCGTGALSATILASASPSLVVGVDQSAGFLAIAKQRFAESALHFARGTVQRLPIRSGTFHVVVSGLMLNFVPDPIEAAGVMARAVRPGGTVALYVWDYSGRMQMMRAFWDAAEAVDSGAAAHNESSRFSLCQPEQLSALFRDAGLTAVDSRAIDVLTRFSDFDDYWVPFLGGQGAAPAYVARLSDDRRAKLRDRLNATLPTAKDGSIDLVARAWAIRGIR